MAATLVWWHVHRDALFYVIGLDEPAATLLGPVLPAVSAGMIAAMALSIVDAAAGPIAGVLAAVVVVALPGFLPLHRQFLTGPPLTAMMLAMMAVMLQSPRFSVAYGTLAGIAAVFIDPAGMGLPLVAVGWAVMVRGRGGNGSWQRVGLAVLPLAVALLALRWTAHAWPDIGMLHWRGRLDEGLQAAGTVVGDQLAPTLGSGTLRWFAIADVSLMLLAILVVAWRRTRRSTGSRLLHGLLRATAVMTAGLVVGLSVRWLWFPGSPPPGLVGVFPIVVLLAMASTAALAALWPRWPTWGKVIAAVLIGGWFQAAIRG